MKKTYKASPWKRLVQSRFLTDRMKDNVVTMGGPSIGECCSTMQKYGAKHFESWETDLTTYLSQIKQKDHLRLSNTIHNGDIIHALIKPNTMYDLDFCSSILYKDHYIEKFDEGIFTFSVRPYSQDFLIETFLGIRDDRIGRIIKLEDDVVETFSIIGKRAKYRGYYYFDSWPMFTIYKL